VLILKKVFGPHDVFTHNKIPNYEFSVFKYLLKNTKIFTLKSRQTTSTDKSVHFYYYFLVPQNIPAF